MTELLLSAFMQREGSVPVAPNREHLSLGEILEIGRLLRFALVCLARFLKKSKLSPDASSKRKTIGRDKQITICSSSLKRGY